LTERISREPDQSTEVKRINVGSVTSTAPRGLDLAPALELLEKQRLAGWHLGAQLYVSLNGEVLLDAAIGESASGRDLAPDDLMLWYSSGKPWTTVAVLRLWEQGRLGLDDLVAGYVDGWGGGKERATIRHVLTHSGGFPMPGDWTYDSNLTFDEAVAATAAAPALWEPGTKAGYHAASGWRVLGAIVERVDGRRIDQYLREEIAEPLGLDDSYLGVPLEVQRAYGDRITPVHWTGHRLPGMVDGALQMLPYRIDETHNEPWHIAKVEPGGGMRGPASQLGRFYESLLGFGPPLLEPRTVEVMRAVHRWGVKDATFGTKIPWGLGVQVDFTGGTGWRAFGHGGMASSRGLADPECGLVLVMVANGLAGFFDAEARGSNITDAVYTALGPEDAPLRRPNESTPRTSGTLST
jgi:CubicO group peptidase (beta-lactamase class C family)